VCNVHRGYERTRGNSVVVCDEKLKTEDKINV